MNIFKLYSSSCLWSILASTATPTLNNLVIMTSTLYHFTVKCAKLYNVTTKSPLRPKNLSWHLCHTIPSMHVVFVTIYIPCFGQLIRPENLFETCLFLVSLPLCPYTKLVLLKCLIRVNSQLVFCNHWTRLISGIDVCIEFDALYWPENHSSHTNWCMMHSLQNPLFPPPAWDNYLFAPSLMTVHPERFCRVSTQQYRRVSMDSDGMKVFNFIQQK